MRRIATIIVSVKFLVLDAPAERVINLDSSVYYITKQFIFTTANNSEVFSNRIHTNCERNYII